MNQFFRRVLRLAFLLLCWYPRLSAVGAPELDIQQLVSASDFIVTGHIVEVRPLPSTTVNLSGRQIPAHVFGAVLMIDQILKGNPETSILEFDFEISYTPASGVGYRSISEGYHLLFLKKMGSSLKLTSPYYGAFPAAPGANCAAGSVEDNVLCELAEAIRSQSVTTDQKQQLLFDLQKVRSPILIPALASALKSDNKVLQLNAATALLQRDDLSAMPIAADLLIHGAPSIPAYLIQNMSSAIGRDVKDPRAIPSLTNILRESKDVYARRAAASALRNTGSASAILPLQDALNDSDSQVRYYAVIGLAEITGSPEWRPLPEDFNSRESYYLQHWKDYSQHK